MNQTRKFQMFFSALLILALAVGMMPGSAKAYGTHTIYVRQFGNDSCDGTVNVNYTSGTSCAKATIAGALAVAVAGDVIYVNNDGNQWNMSISDAITVSTGVEILLADKIFINPDAGKACFVVAANQVRISAEHSSYAGCFGKVGTHYTTVNDGVSDVIIDGLMFEGPGAGTTNDVGVYFAGAVTNVQVVNNFFENIANGIDLKFTSMPTGVADVKGNYFDHTSRGAVSFPTSNSFDIKYNSWASYDGPMSEDVDSMQGAVYSPYTYGKVLFTFDSGHTSGSAIVGDTVTVQVRISAKNLTGADFIMSFPYYALNLTDSSMIGSSLPNSYSLDTSTANTDGKIKFHGLTALASDGQSYTVLNNDSALLFTLTFTAAHSGGSPFAVNYYTKSYAMNPGYGPSNFIPARYSETSFSIYNAGTVLGTASLQGRIARDGVAMGLWKNSSLMFSATSIDQMVGNLSFSNVVDGTYVLSAYRPGYLSLLTSLNKTAGFSSGTRTINPLELKGGDADGDNVIDVTDAGLIGYDYGTSGRNTPGTAFTDINSSGLVDIYDLALMGGNYQMTSASTDNTNAYYNWTTQSAQ